MASEATRTESLPDIFPGSAALQHGPWRRWSRLSRGLAGLERFLAASGFDRGPWLAVAFAGGIVAWFGLANVWQWLGLVASCLALIVASIALLPAPGPFPYLRQSLVTVPLVVALGCLTVWTKSEVVGQTPIDHPTVGWFSARVLDREDRPAEDRVRLTVATREARTDRPIRVRANVPERFDRRDIGAGATIRFRARLMPPAPPMLPGGYDFARTAWFAGLSATGTVIAPVDVLSTASTGEWLQKAQLRLSRHVRTQVEGSSGGIAAALASGDRGAIEEADAQAMRDSGLAHLLSISGLHVSAVIAAAYLLALKLLALSPWLALRVRLPIVAAGVGAFAGLGYTLLTGAEVPTVRSCVGALLVLAALALGREALSLRILAVAAFCVLMLWPESVIGPSFQMSFAAVMAIVALNGSEPVRRFLGPREEGWLPRTTRYFAMLFVTGLLIEIVLMPIALYHFHRAGVYGAIANVIAIPLTTVAAMPLIAIALLLDVIGAGAPAWWLVGNVIDAMLALAHLVASQPGSVTIMPAMGGGSFALFVIGGLWLALWRGRVRFYGLVPAAAGSLSLLMLQPPDILVSGDGRHIGITGESAGELLVLRDTRSDFVRDNLLELAGMSGQLRLLADWPGAKCSRDFCTVGLRRGGREWHLLIARSRVPVPERALAAACDRAHIVIADRWLPRSCRPIWLKADRNVLSRTGGLAIDLDDRSVRTVADGQGRHGWWRGEKR